MPDTAEDEELVPQSGFTVCKNFRFRASDVNKRTNHIQKVLQSCVSVPAKQHN